MNQPPSTPQRNRPYKVGDTLKLLIDAGSQFPAGMTVVVDRVGTMATTGSEPAPITALNAKYHVKAYLDVEKFHLSQDYISSKKVPHKDLTLHKGSGPTSDLLQANQRAYLINDFEYPSMRGLQKIPRNAIVEIANLGALSNTNGKARKPEQAFYYVHLVTATRQSEWVIAPNSVYHDRLGSLI